jgi:hypothetical protein
MVALAIDEEKASGCSDGSVCAIEKSHDSAYQPRQFFAKGFEAAGNLKRLLR